MKRPSALPAPAFEHPSAHPGRWRRAEQGQTLISVALLITVLIGMLGLAVDSGYSYSERRQIQSAADAAALNGAREMETDISTGNLAGSDQQVFLAIQQYITAFNLTVNPSGTAPASLQSAVYINASARATYGAVGLQVNQQIPPVAEGVRVVVQEPWTPFILGALGFSNLTLTAAAAATAGTTPGAYTVFVNCPPFTASQATENLSFSGSGTGTPDTINGNVFVNGNVQASGGGVIVNGTVSASGTVQGSITATGGVSQNQPPQQFPLPDVAFPLTSTGQLNTSLYNTGTAAYTPPGASPELDQEAYWDFYLGYNTGTLPSQGQLGFPPLPSGSYTNGDYVDLYFVVNLPPDALGQISLTSVLAQIPDVTQASYFSAYQGHYSTFFHQWVSQRYATDRDPGTDFPWLHWVESPSSSASDPTTWYTLTPTVQSGLLGFQAQPSQHPVNTFGGQCATTTCFPSGIWWALNWPAGFQCATSGQPCVDMSNLSAAWMNPASGSVVPNAGLTFLTNSALYYQGSSAANSMGWGYQASNHPAEQVAYTGWGGAGTLYVPLTVLYTTFAPPLPGNCATTPPVEALHADGSSQLVSGFILMPYGGITFNGGGASNFRGAIFAAQLSFHGSGVMLSYDAKGTIPGPPALIQ